MIKLGSLMAGCPLPTEQAQGKKKNYYIRIGTAYLQKKEKEEDRIILSISSIPLPHVSWNGWCYIFRDMKDLKANSSIAEDNSVDIPF